MSRTKRPPNAPERAGIPVTKQDVASRELATAIRLWTRDDDPVPIHVLANAAAEIIAVLTRARGLIPIRSAMLDSLSGDLREHMYFHMRESFNFMKHGAKDADETLNFNPTETEWLIYSACVDYLAAFGVAPPEALLFLTYMTDQTPALIRHDVEDPFVSLRQKHRKRTHGARMERRHVARMLAELDELAKDLRARRVKDHPLLRN